METMAEMAGVVNEMKGLLQHVVRQLDGYTQRIEEVMREIATIKDAQNEILAGLALYERVRRLKESLGMEDKAVEIDKSTWNNVQAYCRNCTRMVDIIEPRAAFTDEHTVVEARCKNCGTMVVRTLL
jgi:hypothetical protein